MNEPVTIKEPDLKDKSFDLEALKEQGLQKIQELSGNNWTDFNFHDPGVTILEILCYALTDLAYRADFDLTDLLNSTGKKKPETCLFPPEQILTTGPLSTLDYRRLILDIEGVKNCDFVASHLEKVIPGVLDIKIEIHPDFENERFRAEITSEIRALLQRTRPLGTSFGDIEFLNHDPLGILLDVELSEDIAPNKIFADFIQRAQEYFSPEIKFRGLQELLVNGVPTDIIFNGPLLQNGFLPDEEIHAHSVRKRIFISDLMSLVMAIPGVSFVHELKVIRGATEEFNWICDVSEGCVPRIDPARTKFTCRYKNTVVFESKPEAIELWSSAKLNRSSSHKQNTLDIPQGVPRNLKKYHSIQNDFPETYGIGAKGPSAGANDEKLASIKQLKGYLFIFDQVMANFLSQLDHVKYLFSTEDIENSYAVQLIDEMPGIEYLYKQFIENYYVIHSDFDDKIKLRTEWTLFLKFYRDKLTAQIQNAQETRDEFLRRRNAVLDHLLARFGVDTLNLELLSDLEPAEAIAYKLDFIRYFPKLSSEKYSTGPSSLNPEISGIKCWIAKNLNFKGAKKNEITNSLSDKFNSELNQGDKFRIEVHTDHKPLNALLKNAAEPENVVETAEEEVSIYDISNELIAKIFFTGSGKENKKEFVHQKLRELDQESENFIIVDHISLKPSDDLPCFGFNVLVNNVSFFISERKYTLKDCDDFLNEFTAKATQEENFSIVETAHKEYKIKFTGSLGTLLTRAYYSTAKEAGQQLEYFLEGLKDKNPEFSFFTKYEDHYINVPNPFSHIVTILLPGWPSQFQKGGYKKYIEEYLYDELPAHLVVNVKWLDFEEMKSFERQWVDYLSVAGSGDALRRMTALDKFMNALIS